MIPSDDRIIYKLLIKSNQKRCSRCFNLFIPVDDVNEYLDKSNCYHKKYTIRYGLLFNAYAINSVNKVNLHRTRAVHIGGDIIHRNRNLFKYDDFFLICPNCGLFRLFKS